MQIYTETEQAYGAPRITSELRLGDGIRVGNKAGRAVDAHARDQRRRRQTGRATHDRPQPETGSTPDLVNRDFARAEPNRLSVCDLKHVQTGQGFLSLAVAQDVPSRRITGRSIHDDLNSQLVLDTLETAVSTRGPAAADVVAHPDHSSPHTSFVYGAHPKQSGNAVANSILASLAKKPSLHHERFQTHEQEQLQIHPYIESSYNPAASTQTPTCPARPTTNTATATKTSALNGNEAAPLQEDAWLHVTVMTG